MPRAARPRLGFRPVRILVTGGAGFIGTHFVRRLAAAGDEVVVLDKLTYSGNPANLEGVAHEFHQGDIADPEAVARGRRRAATRSSTSPPRRTSTARSSRPASSSTPTSSGRTSCSSGRARRGRGSSRSRPTRSTATSADGGVDRGRPAAAVEPVRGVEGGRRPAGARVRAHLRRRTPRSRAARTRTGRTSTRRSSSRSSSRTRSTASRCPSTATGARRATGSTSTTTAPAIELVLREGAPGEVYNVGGGEERENVEVTRRILELTGADESLVRHVEDRPGPRPALLARLVEARARSAGRRQRRFEEGLAETVAWYRDNRAWWEPIKSGEYRAYYERAVRGAARSATDRSQPATQRTPQSRRLEPSDGRCDAAAVATSLVTNIGLSRLACAARGRSISSRWPWISSERSSSGSAMSQRRAPRPRPRRSTAYAS